MGLWTHKRELPTLMRLDIQHQNSCQEVNHLWAWRDLRSPLGPTVNNRWLIRTTSCCFFFFGLVVCHQEIALWWLITALSLPALSYSHLVTKELHYVSPMGHSRCEYITRYTKWSFYAPKIMAKWIVDWLVIGLFNVCRWRCPKRGDHCRPG